MVQDSDSEDVDEEGWFQGTQSLKLFSAPVVIKTSLMSLMMTGAAVEAFAKSSFSLVQEPSEKLLIESRCWLLITGLNNGLSWNSCYCVYIVSIPIFQSTCNLI